MSLREHWTRWKPYAEWRRAMGPVLFNHEHGELVRLLAFSQAPAGCWLLKRPLTLPESTAPLFLTTRIRVDRDTGVVTKIPLHPSQ